MLLTVPLDKYSKTMGRRTEAQDSC